ncbi:hypothetical protein [Cupriavidus sp. D39]
MIGTIPAWPHSRGWGWCWWS